MPFKLNKEKSIRKSGEYRLIYQEGVKYPGKYLILFYRSGQEEARVGITVSGKVGAACERNRAKRRIREALGLELEDAGPAGPGGSFVFVATRHIKKASFEDIRKDIRTLLERTVK